MAANSQQPQQSNINNDVTIDSPSSSKTRHTSETQGAYGFYQWLHDPMNHYSSIHPPHNHLQTPHYQEHHHDHYNHGYQEDHLYGHQNAYHQDIRIIKLEGETKKLYYEIEMTKLSFEQFIVVSQDKEYKKGTITHDYLLRSLEKFENLAFSIIAKSQDNLTNMRSLEYLPRNQDLAQFIYNIHEQAESLYTNIKTNLVPIKESLRTRECSSTIDIDDIKAHITMPYFDGEEEIHSLSIFEFLQQSDLFFKKRSTKSNIKCDFIRNHLKEPAFSSCKEMLAGQEDYTTVKKLLIKKYGRLTNLYQNLSKHHSDIGYIPSLQGNSVPWLTILSRVKLHYRLIEKALAAEKHFDTSFINSHSYLGHIIYFLPLEYQLEMEDTDNFEFVHKKFKEILYKAEKMTPQN